MRCFHEIESMKSLNPFDFENKVYIIKINTAKMKENPFYSNAHIKYQFQNKLDV